MANWAETQSIRLDQSYAYADSPADQAVLSAVGYPYVVNPGGRMKRIAAGFDWPILDA